MAGRAGRTGAGRVIFQTWQPEDPVILAAAAHDYEAFWPAEMPRAPGPGLPAVPAPGAAGGHRRDGRATPKRRPADLGAPSRAAWRRPELSVLGPAPAVFPRLQDRYRFQILIKGSLRPAERVWLAECLRALKESRRGIDVAHDVDPVSVY